MVMAVTYPQFVWTQGTRGPQPEIWHLQITRDMKPIVPLQSHDFTEGDQGMTLTQLAEKYPYKPKESENGTDHKPKPT